MTSNGPHKSYNREREKDREVDRQGGRQGNMKGGRIEGRGGKWKVRVGGTGGEEKEN